MAKEAWLGDSLSAEQTRQRKKEAVLTAAARLFCENGYDRTSLDDVAKALNVSKRTLYYYVKNKEEILFLCHRAALNDIEKVIEKKIKKDAKPLDKIQIFFKEYARLIVSDYGRCVSLLGHRELSEAHRQSLNEVLQFLDFTIRGFISEGVKEGSIRPVSPHITSAAIYGAFNWISQWYEHDKAITIDMISKEFLDLFINGIKATPES